MAFTLTSPGFAAGDPIPAKYTCDGGDVPPPLRWAGTPERTQALALVVDDPDARGGAWVHWLVYALPPTVHELAEGAALPAPARTGRNDFQRTGYGGPCPPGGTHRYVFTLYALDAALDLAPGAGRQELDRAMAGHVLAEARLTGTYARR